MFLLVDVDEAEEVTIGMVSEFATEIQLNHFSWKGHRLSVRATTCGAQLTRVGFDAEFSFQPRT